MKNRSIAAVLLLPFVTFGIYGIVWLVKTKNEMNKLGTQIPTAILLIVPFVNIYWYWKYSEGVGAVTNGRLSGVSSFLLMLLLGTIGFAIIQNEFNNLATAATSPVVPTAVPAYDTTSDNLIVNNEVQSAVQQPAFGSESQPTQDSMQVNDQIASVEQSFDSQESNE